MHEIQLKIIDLSRKKDLSLMSYQDIARDLEIANPETIIYHMQQLTDYFAQEQLLGDQKENMELPNQKNLPEMSYWDYFTQGQAKEPAHESNSTFIVDMIVWLYAVIVSSVGVGILLYLLTLITGVIHFNWIFVIVVGAVVGSILHNKEML